MLESLIISTLAKCQLLQVNIVNVTASNKQPGFLRSWKYILKYCLNCCSVSYTSTYFQIKLVI